LPFRFRARSSRIHFNINQAWTSSPSFKGAAPLRARNCMDLVKRLISTKFFNGAAPLSGCGIIGIVGVATESDLILRHKIRQVNTPL
jgi:hypothetical protein